MCPVLVTIGRYLELRQGINTPNILCTMTKCLIQACESSTSIHPRIWVTIRGCESSTSPNPFWFHFVLCLHAYWKESPIKTIQIIYFKRNSVKHYFNLRIGILNNSHDGSHTVNKFAYLKLLFSNWIMRSQTNKQTKNIKHLCPRTHRQHNLPSQANALLLNSQLLPDALGRNDHRWPVVHLTDQNVLPYDLL